MDHKVRYAVLVHQEGGSRQMDDHEVIWSDYVFEGKLIKVRMDTIRLQGGDQREREIVEHPGAVAVIPVLEDGRIVLVRQYRPAVRRSMLELPAGTIEPDEEGPRTAARELEEETGYHGGTLRHLVRFFVSPGWCNEEIVVFVAEGIIAGEQAPEDDEEIAIELVNPDSISGLIRAGEIADAKTMVGLSTYLGFRLQVA